MSGARESEAKAPRKKKARRRLFHRKSVRPGSSPGAFSVPEGSPPPQIHAIVYDTARLDERDIGTPAEASAAMRAGAVAWIDVHGLGDEAVLRGLGEAFEIHPLALADIANTGQRPKAEAYEDLLFCVVRMATLGAEGECQWEQVSLCLGEGWLVSFQERPGDCFDPLRNRLRQGRTMFRASGPDYLACMVIDAIVDGYFPVLEAFGERLEEIEERVLERPDQEVLAEIYRVKRDLMTFRRAAWPLRDVLSHLLRDGHPRLTEDVLPYLRDIADHVAQVVDVVENYRELAGSFVDVYLSSVSHRTNEVMRVLTVIATIFIPLTFIAGVYGMNFDTSAPTNLPELGWRYGYLAFWTVSLGLTAALLLLFRRLGWLGGK